MLQRPLHKLTLPPWIHPAWIPWKPTTMSCFLDLWCDEWRNVIDKSSSSTIRQTKRSERTLIYLLLCNSHFVKSPFSLSLQILKLGCIPIRWWRQLMDDGRPHQGRDGHRPECVANSSSSWLRFPHGTDWSPKDHDNGQIDIQLRENLHYIWV